MKSSYLYFSVPVYKIHTHNHSCSPPCKNHLNEIEKHIIYRVFKWCFSYTRTVWKVRGLTLLLRVGILWRCRDGL